MIENFKLFYTWFRWALVIFPLGLFKSVTAPLLYPLADLMKDWRFNILWVYLDDGAYNEDGKCAAGDGRRLGSGSKRHARRR